MVEWSQIIPIPIDFSAAGDNIIVPAESANTITLVKFFFIVAGDTDLIFRVDGVDLSGPLPFTASMSMFADFDLVGYYTAPVTKDIVLNSSNAVQVSGTAYYAKGI